MFLTLYFYKQTNAKMKVMSDALFFWRKIHFYTLTRVNLNLQTFSLINALLIGVDKG